MKNLILTALALICAIGAISQERPDSIKLKFLDSEDYFIRDMMMFEDINYLNFRLINGDGEKEYHLYSVTVSPDSVTEKDLSVHWPVKIGSNDSIEVHMFAKALNADTASIALSPLISKLAYPQPTANCILIESLPKRAFLPGEEIPLAAYCTGRPFEVEFEGETYQGFQLCDVRNSGLHISQWGKEFKLPTYTYFILRPEKE